MSGWTETPLRALATLNDETLPESFDPGAEISYVEIGGVAEATGLAWNEPVAFGAAPSRARRVIRDGDVIVSTVRTYLRAVAGVERPPSNAVASTGFAVLRPRRVRPGFLRYALLSDSFLREVIARSVGVSYPAINASELMSMRVPVPSAGTQHRVIEYLDRETAEIDAFIADQERLIELLTERRSASLAALVSSPSSDRRAVRLGWVAQIGNGSTPSRDNDAYWSDDGFPWLNSSVVNQDSIMSTDQFVTTLALQQCHLPVVPPGSVLVGITGEGRTRGMATLLNMTATISQHLAFITPNADLLLPDYLLAVLGASYRELRRISEGAGSTKGALTCGDIKSHRIRVPPLSEQRGIAQAAKSLEAWTGGAVADARRAVELLRERRVALISAAVTGQIDVTGRHRASVAVSDPPARMVP
ncbi:MAG: restriction endonuclease subunit S [Bifidobacteriaceae bacterium]|jgi:type I restriction enzyme S subunit|nr:restriction endonuclease subunit S [Bifidobacteriaceae bacterium]